MSERSGRTTAAAVIGGVAVVLAAAVGFLAGERRNASEERRHKQSVELQKACAGQLLECRRDLNAWKPDAQDVRSTSACELTGGTHRVPGHCIYGYGSLRIQNRRIAYKPARVYATPDYKKEMRRRPNTTPEPEAWGREGVEPDDLALKFCEETKFTDLLSFKVDDTGFTGRAQGAFLALDVRRGAIYQRLSGLNAKLKCSGRAPCFGFTEIVCTSSTT